MLKKILKRATAFITVFAISCCIIAAVSPSVQLNATAQSELEQLIAALKKENEELDQQIAGINGDIADNKELQDLYYQKFTAQKDEVDKYNNLLYLKEEEINAKQKEIDALDLRIADDEAEIEIKKSKVAMLEEDNNNNIRKFAQIVRAMYISSGDDVFSVLANSKDFYDLLVRSKMMSNISEANVKFMDELKASIDEQEQMIAALNEAIDGLEADKKKASDDKKQLEVEKTELEGIRSDAEALQTSYNTTYNNYSGYISDLEERQDDLNEQKRINSEEAQAYEKQIQQIILAGQQGSTQIYDNGAWLWPVSPKFTYLTTYFGYDPWRGSNHSGIDIGNAGINGTSIYASKSGTVITAKTTYIQGYSYGKYVVIDHGDGYSTLYGHCSEIYVTVGQQVSQGDIVAAVGSTGWSTGPHLHFEVRLNGVAQNPLDYVAIP